MRLTSLWPRVPNGTLKYTRGVLNQLNETIRIYAEEHDLDLVLGVTDDGSILYGSKALDITDDLIKLLNSTYGSKPTARNQQ